MSVDDIRESGALLAYAMNGEPLPPRHGYPLRVVVPGWYGMASVKWLTEVEVVAEPFAGYFQTARYVYEFERDGMLGRVSPSAGSGSGRSSPNRPTAPRSTSAPASIVVRGVAWSGAAPIAGVEVSVDGGPWQPAEMVGEASRRALAGVGARRPARPPGADDLRARATDRAGNTQPPRPEWNRFGYGGNAIHEVHVLVRLTRARTTGDGRLEHDGRRTKEHAMKYVKLGSTGVEVSPICLGCMSFGVPDRGGHPWSHDEEASRPLIRRAIEAGINFFDTANVYSDGTSEEIIGRALAELANRDEIVLATKVYGRMRPRPNGSGLSRKAILSEIDDSLRRLGTDYVDLYQIHRWDHETPIAETIEALHDVVKAGKARYIGASSMYAWQFAKAQYLAERHGWTPFVTMQNHYNLLHREEEREMLPLCADLGVARDPVEPARPWPPHPGLGRHDRPHRDRRVRPDAVPAGRPGDRRRGRRASPIAAASAGPRSPSPGFRAIRRWSRRSSA